jgi:hypothetical protein
VNPGDAIEVYTDYVGSLYYFSLYDATSTQDFYVDAPCASTCNRSSAEVITEGYVSSPYNGTADFGLVNYTDIIAQNNKKVYGALSNANWATEESIAQGPSTDTDTSPGPLATSKLVSPNESAFNIAWYNEA